MTGTWTSPNDDAPQHAPRPLPLFLSMLRSETAASPERRAAALAGLDAYGRAEREPPMPAMPRRITHGRARLTGIGESRDGRPPVVIVPSLINPPTILDLSPDTSLVRWLAAQGHAAWLLDWGAPTTAERDLDLAGHVEHILLPLLALLEAPPVLVGYCLGGTLALATATLASAAAVATIAAPWHFAGYGAARPAMAKLWEDARPTCEALGLVPMEVLQAGFWQLDAARTVDKFAAFGRMPPGSAEARGFVRLEDWANAGAPLTLAAGRDLFEQMIAADRPGTGAWRIAGRRIDPHALAMPKAEFVSLTDRIVPAATAIGLPDRRDLAAGHVGMIVGRGRMTLWQPLLDWINALTPPR